MKETNPRYREQACVDGERMLGRSYRHEVRETDTDAGVCEERAGR